MDYESTGPAYTHVPYPPDPAKEWVGLTDEEITQCSYDAEGFMIDREVAMRTVAAKLKEKNGG